MLDKIEEKIDIQFEIIEDSIKYQIESLSKMLGIISFIRHLDYFKKSIIINNKINNDDYHNKNHL